MRPSVCLFALLASSCGTTLDGGVHAERCGTAAAASLPLCRQDQRCNSGNDCIPACTLVGCIEGACTYRTGSCQSPGCPGEATAGKCMGCGFAALKRESALVDCLCTACAAACGLDDLCTDVANGTVTEDCAACAIAALIHPGLCASDARFQDACFGGATTCRAAAQSVVACRR